MTQEFKTLPGSLASAAGTLMLDKALKYESDIPHNPCMSSGHFGAVLQAADLTALI